MACALLYLSGAAALGLGAGVGSCLPPDFEIVPRENQPVSIDQSLLTVSPDQYQDLSGDCEPLVLDVSNAIVDADKDDPITIGWLVDYTPGQSVEPDATNHFKFTFDPCTNAKAKPGKVTTIEAVVLDRAVPLDVLNNADLLTAYDGNDVTKANVIWFTGFVACDANACPTVGP